MLRHLKESTDTVTSRKKLTKLIITLVYWGFWVLAISGYWIFWIAGDFAPVPLPGFVKDMDVRSIHYLFVIPFTAVIAAFMGAHESFGGLRWLYVPISGVMFMLFQILTVQLMWEISIVTFLNVPLKPLNVFKWYFVDENWFLSLVLGLGSSALGMWIGTFIRHAIYYAKSQKEKESQ